jgi:hypothetical protein
MVARRPSVEGIEVINIIRQARETVLRLRDSNWNFERFPEVFAKNPAADVLAKEIVHIHDGRVMTRIGRLYMGGVGPTFNLMGPIPADSVFKVGPATALEQVNKQLGSRGLRDLKEFRALGKAQPVEFFNYSLFYGMEDLVFWALVHDAGVFPSGLEHMARHFAAGNLVQNSLYSPATPSRSKKAPAVMASVGLNLSFPTRVVEWMDKPLYGGLVKETIHVESLLTPKQSKVSHPYLPLVGEGKVKLDGAVYYVKRFSGITPKEGLRGPGVPEEGKPV